MKRISKSLRIVAIGTSAGGITALRAILPSFTVRNLAVVVVIHLPPEGPNLIPALFKDECAFEIKEAESGETLSPGTIYIAPPGYHLSAESNGTVSLSNEDEINFSRPSIDILFESVAFAYKEACMAILLTGANQDGAQGLKTLSEFGGVTVVQSPESAEYPVMPESALKILSPDYVLDLDEMAALIRTIP